MSPLEKAHTGIRRSRRNLIKIGVIAASSTFARLANAQLLRPGPGPGPRPGGPCFLKGTTIQTVDGHRKIEDLAVGDLLPTVFGGICPIQWIGRYPFKKSDLPKAWEKTCCRFGSLD